ncbi:cyclin-like protein [Neoconidiobolus thromboides FSU 785]|nr:cyclin-like protein [Neoconidiobolus thromboides FSU 785]
MEKGKNNNNIYNGYEPTLELVQEYNKGWYFTKDQLENETQSRREGITLKVENKKRVEGIKLINYLSKKLRVSQVVTATASLFFHRYYYKKNIKSNNIYDVGSACFLVGTKAQESVRKIRDIAVTTAQYFNEGSKNIEIGEEEIEKWIKTIVKAELELLIIIEFRFLVELPYVYLFNFEKELAISFQLVKSTWSVVNDSYKTFLCLLYEPKIVAAASLLLGYRRSKCHSKQDEIMLKNWYQIIDVPIELINDALVHLNELYDNPMYA